ncbi:MAG: sugar nucleotide-binding protein, partial [Cytophaga sp.]|nr:sugar nucleotide-binding protein [Undibacterium sp.]
YGASKAAGDALVNVAQKHYLLRTSWVIGEGKNFVRAVLDLANRGVNPAVVADQIGRSTFTSELVRAMDHLLTTNAPFGIYNVSNDGDSVSLAEETRVIFKEAGLSNTVSDVTTANYYAGKENIAPRPSKSTLSLEKLQATGFTSRNWLDDLRNYLNKETI